MHRFKSTFTSSSEVRLRLEKKIENWRLLSRQMKIEFPDRYLEEEINPKSLKFKQILHGDFSIKNGKPLPDNLKPLFNLGVYRGVAIIAKTDIKIKVDSKVSKELISDGNYKKNDTGIVVSVFKDLRSQLSVQVVMRRDNRAWTFTEDEFYEKFKKQ